MEYHWIAHTWIIYLISHMGSLFLKMSALFSSYTKEAINVCVWKLEIDFFIDDIL